MSRKGILTVALLFAVTFLLLHVATRGYREVEALQSLEKAMAAVRRDFPEAKPVSTEQLAAWMSESGGVLILDAREEEEFAVSRIPGATKMSPESLVEALESGDGRIVVCDSVGFRSAEKVAAVEAGKAERLFYLEGGLFQWANERRPLVDPAGAPTTKVHPYNQLWGRLLKP